MDRMRKLLWTVLLLVPMVSGATGWPQPEADAVYVERDPAAIAMHPRPGNNAAFRRQLNDSIRANPRNSFALVHRAYLFHASGDIEEGDRDFRRVLDLTDTDPINRRRALWSLGWSAYNRGETEQAVGYWQQAADLHGGWPSWYPYTMAVGLWTLGDQATALAWYDAAVRSQPQWARYEGVRERTGHWREPERQALAALFQAWSTRTSAAAADPAG
jgi:tetratricopeptide (TPR) repeat protein